MKTAFAPTPAQYRNDAVFRSAELLIASQGKKTARTFPRWFVFVAGLLLGIGGTVLAVSRSHRGAAIAPPIVSAPETPPTIAPSVAQFFSERTIRGHLFFPSAAPVSVEFTVRHVMGAPGNPLTGVVRYLNGNYSIAEHTLQGEIRNSTLLLRETGSLTPAEGSAAIAGRTFELQFPTDAAFLSKRFAGTWSLGAQRGTLSAVIATPW